MRFRAPFLGQQRVHAEGTIMLSWLHVGKSFISRETTAENIFAPNSPLWACDVLLFYSCEAFYVISVLLD